MERSSHLTGQLLLAMPALEDPNFQQTVTFVCEHNDEGAMGVVINRAMELSLAEVLRQMDLTVVGDQFEDHPVYVGGPVQQERGFVIHQPNGDWEATLAISEDIGVTTSRDILSAMVEGKGPEQVLMALGYAGWGPGQLEAELAANSWLNVPADGRLLFEVPHERRYIEAARSIGVDMDRLSGEAGHA